jgi:hypothetical protein
MIAMHLHPRLRTTFLFKGARPKFQTLTLKGMKIKNSSSLLHWRDTVSWVALGHFENPFQK